MTTRPGWKDPNDYSILEGRSIIVTGGASGLGEATVVKYAEHGAYVTIADVNEKQGQALAKSLSGKGGKVSFVRCDTSSWESCVAAFQHAVKFAPSKTLESAVLFAGIAGGATSLVDEVIRNDAEPSLEREPVRPVHTAININLLGVYYCSYLALHYFRLPPASEPQTRPLKKSLVLFSSMMGYVDSSYNTDYGAAKFGVRGIFRSIRSQVQKIDCCVNLVAPGYILTPLTRKTHQIEDASEASKISGLVLPWAPMEYVTEGVGKCVCDEGMNGKFFPPLLSNSFEDCMDRVNGD
jgi:5'-hydroxyaverantin dehydrogenase